MYVKEYLQFVAGVHSIVNRDSAIAKVIELTGMQIEQKKKIAQLSKGYKQRVGLAAALIHDPEVLILDEPTSGLDPNQIIEIRNVIQNQGQHKTVLFSSHILQEVQAVCNRVIIINKGKIVADDTVAHLQNANKQSQIVTIQFDAAIEPKWLQSLDSVQNVREIQPFRFSIQNTNPELVRKQVLELSLQHNLNIVSLQTEIQSLEDVFRELTSKQ